MKKLIFLLLFIFISSCSTLTVHNKADLDLTTQELTQIQKSDNITPEQRIIIKHALAQLKNAQLTNKENVQLQNKVVKESRAAGAGRLMYWIIGVVILGLIAFIIAKIKGFF